MKHLALIFWTLFCTVAIIGAYLYAFVWIFYQTIGKWIRKNDEALDKDWEDTDNHPWVDGDCCRCEICTKQYHDDLMGDIETITDLNHNLSKNKAYENTNI